MSAGEYGEPIPGSKREKAKSANYLPDVHRLLPQSPDAEKGCLGSLLLDPKHAHASLLEMGVVKDAFHIPAHGTIFEAIASKIEANEPVDFITLTQTLRDLNKLEQCGGAAFVTDLFTFVPTAANVEYYAEIVAEKYQLRQAIEICTNIAGRSYDDGELAETIITDLERGALSIRKTNIGTAKNTKDLVMEAIESIERLYERRGSISGLATGFAELDMMIDGLHAEEMIVIAARPSMGKSAIAMNIAEHIAIHDKKRTLIFSLEMSTQQLMQRLLCSMAKVNLVRLRNGHLSERDFPSLTAAAAKIAQAKDTMFFDDTASISIQELAAKARRYHADEPLQFIVIDYLQLLTSKTKRAQENRQQEVAEISTGIKKLARELKIPIVVLAQINRAPEQGAKNRTPRLSDLRESGSIEQDADLVAFLVREEVYAETDEERYELAGQAELIVAKQRNGPTGPVPLTFLKEFTRFEDRSIQREENPTLL